MPTDSEVTRDANTKAYEDRPIPMSPSKQSLLESVLGIQRSPPQTTLAPPALPEVIPDGLYGVADSSVLQMGLRIPQDLLTPSYFRSNFRKIR
jgi:hypothetical protein